MIGLVIRSMLARRVVKRARALMLRAAVCITCCLLAATCIRTASAQSDDGFVSREYPLKSLFLYNFGTYIEWPPDAFADGQAPFVIGVLGNSPVEETLQQIAAKKQIAGRKIVIQRFAAAADVKPCQILFIPRSVPAQQQQLALAALVDQPVLIVGETTGFAAAGGAVNFYVSGNKIRFEINPTAVKQRHLKVSSKLLAMAQIVEPSARESIER